MTKVNSSKKIVTVAVAGNPNCGKTVLFNYLTGAKQQVGNWPGVTVEKKEGCFVSEDILCKVIDLPGTYSLGAYSADEAVAMNYILFEDPNVVVNIIDSTNIERNLYLTCQLLEMGSKVIIALNMYDEAKARNIKIDVQHISSLLGVPVIPMIATKGLGITELIQQIKTSTNPNITNFSMKYSSDIEKAIHTLQESITQLLMNKEIKNLRWIAIKLLEGDPSVTKFLKKNTSFDQIETLIDSLVERLESLYNDDIEAIFAEKRYGFISGIVKESVKRNWSVKDRLSITDKIDKIVTNRILGIPIFLFAVWAVFQLTFTIGNPLSDIIDMFFNWFKWGINSLLNAIDAPDFLNSLIVNGIISGVGSVIVFMPNIFLLFFAISLLEDSGYMARAAYITDRFMHMLGLHGKSFIPMIIGFGCNVPAILATRTLENRRDRLITILINPLMSCSARLPIYILFTSVFFPTNQGLVIFSIYLLGIVLAVGMGVIFKKLIFRGETSHFVMELPPYRIPTLKSTLIHMWDRGSSFIRKSGTVIVAVVVLVWVLSSLPSGIEYASKGSLLGRIGTFIAPIFSPAGFGTWQASVSLMFGIVAKEVVVGTLGTVYGASGGITSMIANAWTALSAFSFMVMTLIYIPCIATIEAIKRETNSWKWTSFAVGYSLLLGWIMSVIIYQVGALLGYS